MPLWVLDADTFMQLYPGLTPGDVLGMDLDAFEWLPVVRAGRVKAAEMRAAADAPARGGWSARRG
jgi:hypothetical protein